MEEENKANREQVEQMLDFQKDPAAWAEAHKGEDAPVIDYRKIAEFKAGTYGPPTPVAQDVPAHEV